MAQHDEAVDCQGHVALAQRQAARPSGLERVEAVLDWAGGAVVDAVKAAVYDELGEYFEGGELGGDGLEEH